MRSTDSKITVRPSALQENEATSRTTHKQPTKALLHLYLLTGFGPHKGTHHELDTSFYDLQGRVKGPVLYHRKGHFSLFSDPMGLSNLQHNQKGFEYLRSHFSLDQEGN